MKIEKKYIWEALHTGELTMNAAMENIESDKMLSKTSFLNFREQVTAAKAIYKTINDVWGADKEEMRDIEGRVKINSTFFLGELYNALNASVHHVAREPMVKQFLEIFIAGTKAHLIEVYPEIEKEFESASAALKVRNSARLSPPGSWSPPGRS